jgi:DNA mismatch repair ATPase MutS
VFPQWVQVCYELDAYTALANFAYVNPDYVFPTLVAETRHPKSQKLRMSENVQPIFDARDLGHPLIPHAQAICNDFTFNAPGEMAILTGSNMAGKSTFLKSIGINLCLAYAGAPVVATQFSSVPFRLATCIHITDSVTDGFSYFYAEVQCLKRLLQELKTKSDLPLLYLIDEIFRGTNNRERLQGSRAYVQSLLQENGVGLVATHDLELASLADQRPQIHNYHFRDDVADGKLVFDYKLHPGPCPTTNALKIMQMAGLPIE